MNGPSDTALPLWAQHAIWMAGQPEVMMVLAGLLLASLFLVARRRFVRDPVSVLFLVLAVTGALMIAGLGQAMDSATLYHDTYYIAVRYRFLAALLGITLAFWALVQADHGREVQPDTGRAPLDCLDRQHGASDLAGPVAGGRHATALCGLW